MQRKQKIQAGGSETRGAQAGGQHRDPNQPDLYASEPLSFEVKNLSFAYGNAQVLQGVSLNIDEGDFAGIIGPNGSGKSTLLKNMAALLQPDQGQVLLNRRELGSYRRRDLARRLALVGQEHTAGFNFSVEELVAMGRSPYLPRFSSLREDDRQAIRQAMHLTGCYDLRHRELYSLSGGEKQRVVLARALAQETPCLFLDEPTSFLDIGYQVELLELLQHLNIREKLTILMVMHDLNLASIYCRRLFLLNQGRIVAHGSPAQVLTRQNILEVYQLDVLVEPHPINHSPQIVPITAGPRADKRAAGAAPGRAERKEDINEKDKKAPPEKTPKVHIIGGGGTAAPYISALFLQGLEVTAGVFNAGDSDWAAAHRLGIAVVEEAPFSPISPEQLQENLALIEQADILLLAPFFFGTGNVKNLEAACKAAEMGKPIIVIDSPPLEERDFTDGRAGIIYRDLLSSKNVKTGPPEIEKLIKIIIDIPYVKS